MGENEKKALNFAKALSTSLYFLKQNLNYNPAFYTNLNKLRLNNGNFDDCTKDILRDLLEDSDSDEDDIYSDVKSLQVTLTDHKTRCKVELTYQ